MKLQLSILTGLLIAAFTPRLGAMERWSALSQLESGNNDHAIGRAGEVSRYQIAHDVWELYAPTNASWENPTDALAVAKQIMESRRANFERVFHRPPTDFEFYVLWNAPAQIKHPSPAVSERGRRFCNLLDRGS